LVWWGFLGFASKRKKKEKKKMINSNPFCLIAETRKFIPLAIPLLSWLKFTLRVLSNIFHYRSVSITQLIMCNYILLSEIHKKKYISGVSGPDKYLRIKSTITLIVLNSAWKNIKMIHNIILK
jgi:hypothetical protein